MNSLSLRTKKKFFVSVALVQKFGHKLPEPHSKYVSGSIFELRFVGEEGRIRIMYFFMEGDKAVFANGFIKKSAKLPKKEKQLAIQRRRAYLNRIKKG
ncbi:MAG: phage-related protein [Candidatus Omnitrophota bacterium]|jgi:phage-related protein